jgi:hypothetical protein
MTWLHANCVAHISHCLADFFAECKLASMAGDLGLFKRRLVQASYGSGHAATNTAEH